MPPPPPPFSRACAAWSTADRKEAKSGGVSVIEGDAVALVCRCTRYRVTEAASIFLAYPRASASVHALSRLLAAMGTQSAMLCCLSFVMDLLQSR